MTDYLLSIIFILYPAAVFLWGRLVMSYFQTNNESLRKDFYCFILGIFLTNLLVLLLKVFGLSWNYVWIVILLPIPFNADILLQALKRIKLKKYINLNLALWISVTLFIGCSLFEVTTEGIQSIWVSNYGDLAFHLGMLSSFNYGDNFYPQYNIFAGHVLSYPFMSNLWSALFWSISSSFAGLKYIFIYNWLIVWTAVYFLLNSKCNKIAPWALLLGGGVYFTWTKEAPPMIDQGYFWVPLLPTTWIPQRSAMLGLLLFLTVLNVYRELKGGNSEERRYNLLLLCLLMLSFPLVHGHFYLMALGYIVGDSALRFLLKQNISIKELIQTSIVLLPAMLSSFVISDKAKIFSLMYDWSVGKKEQQWYLHTILEPFMQNPIWHTLVSWIVNCLPVLILFAFFCFKSRDRVSSILLILLFLVGNFVKMHYWDFDQVKFFVALYVLFIFIWTDKIRSPLLQLLLIPLLIPGMVNLFWTIADNQLYTTYSAEDISQAEKIRKVTPVSAVIAAAPEHNSAALLSGRKFYLGFIGTLWTHGIDYQEREDINRDLNKILDCKNTICPEYIYWSEKAREYWNRNLPPKGFSPTSLPFLYKVR